MVAARLCETVIMNFHVACHYCLLILECFSKSMQLGLCLKFDTTWSHHLCFIFLLGLENFVKRLFQRRNKN